MITTMIAVMATTGGSIPPGYEKGPRKGAFFMGTFHASMDFQRSRSLGSSISRRLSPSRL